MLLGLRFLSLRYWLRHRGAFLLATLGVALGVAVFVAIQIANASVLGAFGATVDAVAGRANLQIRGGANGLPDKVYTRILQRPDSRILAAAPSLSRTLPSPSLRTALLVSGVDIFAEIPFRERDLSSNSRQSPVRDQSGPDARRGVNDESAVGEFLLDRDAAAVSRSLAERHDLKIGSRISISVGPRREELRVVSILSDEAAGRAFGGDYVLIDIATAQEKFGAPGELSGIDLMVNERDVEAVARDLKALVPPDATVSRPAQRSEQVAGMLAAFQLNLTALSSIAAFVGAFLIYNAMASAVVRRRSEAGILRAVGASKQQITGLFLLEAAILGTLGGALGFFLGLLLAKWTLGAVATTVSQLYLAVKARELFIPLWLFPLSIGAGAVLSVLAAWPSAHEAAQTQPRAALSSSTLHTALERVAPRLLFGSLFLSLLAMVLCLPALSGSSPVLGFVAAGAMLGAWALTIPFLLMRVSVVIRPIAERIGGVEGALAADNLRRALGRSSLVVAALFVCLALTIGMNLMVRSFRATVGEWIANTVSADLYIATAGGFDGERMPGLPREVLNWARSAPGVTELDTLRRAPMEIEGLPVVLLANELPTLRSGERVLRFLATRSGEAQAKSDFLSGRAVLISERLSNLLELSAGEALRFPTPQGEKSFPIAGVFYDYNPNAVFYLSRAVYRDLWNDDEVDGLALYLEEGRSARELKTRLERNFGARYALQLLPNDEIRKAVFDTFDQTFAVTYALQIIALVVAGIGVFDTLVSMMLERTSEVASLRAMGASRAQIQKTALAEFALLGGIAWVMGSLAGALLAAQIIFIINRQFFGWTIWPQFSVQVFLGALVLALGAALVAGFWPARQSARRDLATALQRE